MRSKTNATESITWKNIQLSMVKKPLCDQKVGFPEELMKPFVLRLGLAPFIGLWQRLKFQEEQNKI